MTPAVTSVNTEIADTGDERVDELGRAARGAAAGLGALGGSGRARLLEGLAEALEGDRDGLVAVADEETGLGPTRLNGELTRTAFQLRLFAAALREGSYLEVTIDHPGDTPMGPRPDLRRMLTPLGPVAVFGASNFPFAFSVPGGDTASALAAGCPVVIKAHPAHPRTSLRCFAALDEGRRAAGAPEGTLGLVFGERAGARLVVHPEITAVGFTGSRRGGRVLHDLAAARAVPIPFYGELGSLNPLVVTPAAAAERAEEIAEGFAASFTLGSGQFCTKPGVIFVPDDEAGRRLRSALEEAVRERAVGPMLTPAIRAAFVEGAGRRAALAAVGPEGPASDDPGRPAETGAEDGGPAPVLVSVAASELPGPDGGLLGQECFGPFAVVAGYRDPDELLGALGRLEPGLTATVHVGAGETELPRRLLELLQSRAGRLVVNGYPTGVAVSWAMQHGGPYPASTSAAHTSVGVAAMRRFLRPVCYQDTPDALLPDPLREANPLGLPRRVDGRLETATA